MVDHELDELKREFLAEAEEKVAEMKRVAGEDRSPAALERLAYLAHQLKGAGGSYGYQKISSDAADLEKAVEQVTESGSSDALDQAIRDGVARLESEIAKGLTELSAASA